MFSAEIPLKMGGPQAGLRRQADKAQEDWAYLRLYNPGAHVHAVVVGITAPGRKWRPQRSCLWWSRVPERSHIFRAPNRAEH